MRWWNELWENHRGKTVGMIGAFLMGVVYLISGFWDMLFVLLLLLIGFYIGSKADRGEIGSDLQRLYSWLTDRWNPFR